MELTVPGRIYEGCLHPKPRGKPWPKPEVRARGRGTQAIYDVPRKEAIQILLHIKSKMPDPQTRSWLKQQKISLQSGAYVKKTPAEKKVSSKKSMPREEIIYECPVCHQKVGLFFEPEFPPYCRNKHLKGQKMELMS